MSADKSTEPTIGENTLLKALGRMTELAKGQIVGKLPGNNEPKGTWSEGKEPTEVSDEDADVSGDSGEEERGGKKSDTDYRPKASPVKKAIDKDGDDDTEPGEDDDADEGDGGDADDFTAPPDDDQDADEAKDGDAGKGDEDAEKSFAARARASRRIRKGIEVSPFLHELVQTLGKSLRGMERRILRDVRRQLGKGAGPQRTFNKSISEVLSGLGAVAMEQGDLLRTLGSQPARGPKSVTSAARPIHKSFDGEDGQITLVDGSRLPQLEKSEVARRLLVGVHKGLFSPSEVVKFESQGIVQPDVYKALVSDERLQK